MHSMSSDSDEALLSAAAGGDESAFLHIYERHRDPLFRFVRRLCGSRELAEDVTHDCFVSLIRNAPRYDPRHASLRTYLCAAGRNLAWSHMRRSGRESRLEDEADGTGPLAGVSDPGPLDQLLESELQRTVASAVSALPPLQREALILFEYEDFALSEIAHVAGAAVGTIKSRLHRARASLRRALGAHLGDEAETARRVS